MKSHWVAWIIPLALGLHACAARRSLERGDQLLDAGQPQAAVAVLEQGLRDNPNNNDMAGHLQRARREALAGALRQAQSNVQAAQFHAAWEALTHARAYADALHEPTLSGRADDLQRSLVQAARDHVDALINQGAAHGDYSAALALSDWLVTTTHDPEVQTWAAQAQGAIAAGHRRLALTRLTDHPGSAALHFAMARALEGATVPDPGLIAAWQRFLLHVCYADPEVEVHDTSEGAVAMGDVLRSRTAAQLQAWRGRCGAGDTPLHVHVLVDGVEAVNQAAKAPAAAAVPGVNVQTEEVVQTQEPVRTTREITQFENRVVTVMHRDCPTDAAEAPCRTWNEQVHKRVPVRRLQVVEGSRAVDHRRVLPALPEDKILRFERVTVTRQVSCHGRIAVDSAGFASLPFAASAESVDSGHPEVVHGEAVLVADPLEARDLASLTHEAAQHAAEMVQMAVQEAAWDRAQSYAEAAAQVQASQPDAAEEAYLSMLALGLDGGQPVREFLSQRYGRSAAVVLRQLGQALGASPPGSEEAAADLTLLFPRHTSNSSGIDLESLSETLTDKGTKP